MSSCGDTGGRSLKQSLLAIGEYNWGGLEHLNGALTQADVLGIFGREGLDLATMWSPPAADQPGAFAFRMYRNYDGNGGAFGDIRIRAVSSDHSRLAVYAAQRGGDQALTMLVINKTNSELTSLVTLQNAPPALSAQVFRYSAANLNAIQNLPEQIVSATGFTATFPAQLITLFVMTDQTALSYVFLPVVRQ